MEKILQFVLAILLGAGVLLSYRTPVYASRLYTTTLETLQPGGTRTVQVHLDTQGEAVNAVSAYIAYPSDLVTAITLTPSDSFSIEAENTIEPNLIKISRGNIDPITGDVVVATITFSARAVGQGNLTFTADSAAPRVADNTDSLTSTYGSAINVENPITPDPQAQPTQSETPGFLLAIESFFSSVSDFFFS